MKGFVPTPRATVDAMVDRLFEGRPPKPSDTVLDPGCGTGEFIDGVIRWCALKDIPLPRITGIELDPRHLPVLRDKYERCVAVNIELGDFLTNRRARYDFILGNPPYVSITSLSESEKTRYRALYGAARGRFDLYLLFFEQALRCLAPDGRLVFITPEKYLYVDTAGPLRALLAEHNVEEIRLVSEDTFGALVTYPTITVLRNSAPGETHVIRRDGSAATVTLPGHEESWLPLIEGSSAAPHAVKLGDICCQISCGIATGADTVFVKHECDLDERLLPFAHRTIAGRQLTPETSGLPRGSMMLIPYDSDGRLLPLANLGTFGRYLMRPEIRERLLARTCVKHKPWYAFHETPVLRNTLRPKILCKDICERAEFWVDRLGQIVPRHSVYYLVPRNPGAIDVITTFLRSKSAQRWLAQNCQRASKGFLRLQSRVLQRMPVPDEVADAALGRVAGQLRNELPQQSEFAFAG
jgi:adenine-specific DNA-methyltransferase